MFQTVERMTAELKEGRALIVHAAEGWFPSVQGGKFDFFTKIGARALEAGVPCHVVSAERQASERLIATGRHLNIVIGPRGPVGPGIWHAHPGYVRGFWYLDPAGVNMHSTLGGRRFEPETVDAAKAQWFFNGVTGYHLRHNVSKFDQAARGPALPAARAVVYLQEIEHFQRPVHWVDSLTMLRVVSEAAGDQRVYVKLHPAQSDAMRAAVQALVADRANLHLSGASIHDLSAASAVVVSQNSAAGFEALMQRKPVITCAQSDYHHATLQARSPMALARAVVDAAGQLAEFDYERYLYWFLGLALLEPGQAEFTDRAWAILTG